MSVTGTIKNGVVVLDQPGALPEGAQVEVVLREKQWEPTPLGQRLLKLAGTVDDLPADMARNHDHYIHGAPRR